jgi:hypothetical protein
MDTAANAAFFARAASELSRLGPDEDIYGHIARLFQEIAGKNTIIAVSESDEQHGRFKPRALLGLEKWAHILKNHIGVDILKIESAYPPELVELFTRGKFVPVPGGFEMFAGTAFPRFLKDPIQKLLGIKEIRVIGFVKGVKTLGALAAVFRGEGQVPDTALVEAFAAEVANALDKRRSEEAPVHDSGTA